MIYVRSERDGGAAVARWQLLGYREDGLQVGGFLFAVDGGDVGGAEAGLLEEVQKLDLGEAEPDVGVEFAGLFEGMALEVEDDDAAAGLQYTKGFVDGLLGVEGVVERLAEEGQVHGGVGEGKFFEVAELELHVFDAGAAGDAVGVFDHFLGVIDADDLFGALGEEEGEGAFAGADVGDAHGREEADEHLREALPGAAGNVVLSEAAGEFVEVGADAVLALFEDEAEGFVVVAGLGELEGGLAEEVGDGLIAGEAVEAFLSGAAEFDEFGLAELGEGHGDAGLAHGEDLLEFGDGEFLAFEEAEHAESAFVTEEAECFEEAGHVIQIEYQQIMIP